MAPQRHKRVKDWLGTKRVELDVTGISAGATGEQCQSQPFGVNLTCTGNDVNQLHFRGKWPAQADFACVGE